jgi:hypothetical protein
VNHGGVSKRDWANLHRALRRRSEGLGALVVNQNKKDLKKARQNKLWHALHAVRLSLPGATQQI